MAFFGWAVPWVFFNAVLDIPTRCYFDDFPSIQPACLARSIQLSAETILRILGWKFAESGDKSPDYAEVFHALGSQIDLSGFAMPLSRPSSLRFTVGNKPGRAKFICSLLDSLCKADAATRRDLSVIRGHLNFASGLYVLRAAGNLLSSALLKSRWRIDGVVRGVAEKIKSLVSCKPPRTVSCSTSEGPILIFTDSAFHDELATMGAAVFFPSGETLVYDGEIAASTVKAWQSLAGKQIISQAELAALLSIQHSLASRLSGKRVIYFIDNEAARFSAIKGVSTSSTMMQLAQAFHSAEADIGYYPWKCVETFYPRQSPARKRCRGICASRNG